MIKATLNATINPVKTEAPMQREPTPKQQRFLTYLKEYLQNNGRLPSLRQAAQDLEVSHAAVAQLVKKLETKGYLRRKGRYSRTLYLLNRPDETVAAQRIREVPMVGRVTAGLPMYAQQEWDGSLVVDKALFPGQNLFALRIRGDSMTGAGILDGDLAICEPRQYARNGEIVVALIDGEEATVKRFFLRSDHIVLHPENPAYPPMQYDFGRVLIQGKVVGIQRGPKGIK
jgi:repressor LexA